MNRLRSRPLTPDEAEALAAELDEDELDERIESICLAPLIDEARTLTEAAHELLGFALWLVDLERDGWQLVEEAGDGHLRVINADARKRVFAEDA
jgi:hypothetical protein